MVNEEERLTEAEWEARRAQEECLQYGHDWHLVQTMAGPEGLECNRPCGDPGYRLVRREE